ncbi:hypothetical protein [Anabaena azotica]|uniref:hypothetical protein n=1 Tax=Anabaena azotica TaxID=197653 RepID=UPI0039A68F0D
MLLIENQQESMKTRIEKIVNILMEERPLFKDELNAEEMVQHLCNTFHKNVSFEEFKSMEQEDLKNRCSGILSVQMLSGLLDDLTPEQIAIFDEAVKRK